MSEVLYPQGPPDGDERIEFVSFDQMEPNPFQPRSEFSEAELEVLKVSIQTNGLLQKPVLRVHPENEEQFQIIAGERRVRACQRIPDVNGMYCVVRIISDKEAAQLGFAENNDRVDLNVIETAFHYRTMIEQFGQSQKDLAAELRVSEPVISNRLRLLELPASVIDLIRQKRLSEAHGKILCSLVPYEAPICELAVKAVSEELATRPLETLVKERKAAIEALERQAREAAEPTLPLDDPKPVITQLSVDRWRILECLERNPGLTSEELSTCLGIEYTFVEQSLEQMAIWQLVKADFHSNENHWLTLEKDASSRITGISSKPHPVESGEGSEDDVYRDGDRMLTGVPAKIYQLLKNNEGSLNAKQIKVRLALSDLDLNAALEDMKSSGLIVGNVVVLDSGQGVELYQVAPVGFKPAIEPEISLDEKRVFRFIKNNPRTNIPQISEELELTLGFVRIAIQDLTSAGLVYGEDVEGEMLFTAGVKPEETDQTDGEEEGEAAHIDPAKDSVTAYVDPDFIAYGSAVEKSVSCQEIGEKQTIRKPFEYGGKLMVGTSSCGKGGYTGYEYIECYFVVPESEFAGEAWNYGQYQRYTYHGIRVKYQGKPYVLSGPKTIFRPKEPAISGESLKVLRCIAEGLGVTLQGLATASGFPVHRIMGFLTLLKGEKLIENNFEGVGWLATEAGKALVPDSVKAAPEPKSSKPAPLPVLPFVQVEGPPVTVIVSRSESAYLKAIEVEPDEAFTAYRRMHAIACAHGLTVDASLERLESQLKPAEEIEDV